MSDREKVIAMLDSVPDCKIGYVLAYIQGIAVSSEYDEAADDAFCQALCEEYDADPDKGEAISIEEAARQLGVTL